MARKGQFKKGGGRVGDGGGSRARSRRKAPAQIVVVGPRAPRAPRRSYPATHLIEAQRAGHPVAAGKRRKAHHKRRIVGGSPVGYAATAAALAWIDSKGNAEDAGLFGTVNRVVDKLPGAKTLGRPATAGIALGAIEHFTSMGGSLRPYMRLAGVVGVVLAGAKVGGAGAAFKWLGDDTAVRSYQPPRRKDPFEIDAQ